MKTIKKNHFDFQPKMLFLFSCCFFCWNGVKNHRFKCAYVSWIVPPGVALFHIIWNINTNIRLYKIWLFPKTFLSVAYLEQTKKKHWPISPTSNRKYNVFHDTRQSVWLICILANPTSKHQTEKKSKLFVYTSNEVFATV